MFKYSLHQIEFCLLSIVFVCSSMHLVGQDYSPPPANSELVCDTFFGSQVVCERFRWLEEYETEKTISWVSDQDKLSKKYLSRSRNKSYAFDYISQYSEVVGDWTTKFGNYYVSFYGPGSSGNSSVGIRTSRESEARIIVRTEDISKTDLISIEDIAISHDSKYLAYEFGRNGSDNREIKIADIAGESQLVDHLVGVKFSSIAWLKNGFCYSIWEQESFFGAIKNGKVYYHELGRPQSEDKLVFKKDFANGYDFRYTSVSQGQYLYITDFNANTKKYAVFFIDASDAELRLQPLIRNIEKPLFILERVNDSLIAKTMDKGITESIVTLTHSDPYKWSLLIAADSERVMLDLLIFPERMVVIYLKNQKYELVVYDLKGVELYNLNVPFGHSVEFRTFNPVGHELLFSIHGYATPTILYTLDLYTYKTENRKPVKVNFDFSNCVTEQVFCHSNDGAEIPITLIYNKKKRSDGPAPCILEAYGGFGTVSEPAFDPGIVYLINNGGIYAFANIRGGGEKGVGWSTFGRGAMKQNSFDDFIAAAEFLINNGYTSEALLGSIGYSNGGLVVAASAIQRPDLFKVVVPVVAPFDMVRFEKFTVGRFHTDEYGTAHDSLGLVQLRSYSPLHNIKEDINYPSMLVVTGENDDRVPPFHSYKFVATLQNRSAQKNPVLLNAAKRAGHNGPVKSHEYMDQLINIYGFMMYEIRKSK